MRRVVPPQPDLEALARSFFQLLETDRSSELFLARFQEVDQGLEAALQAQEAGMARRQEAAGGAAKP
ncbi:hypothetical protein [Limnochorda sp.]|uniref:hypothetical protein n=1 Tax=Limnochorda sp. TaxID=1940279 RepID=UPI00185CB685|nr:hypothetical protein [Bacillota bacterium]MBO2519465.1 hypothetical protein [Bacillota bacterium]NMA71631.1 hypothetical protein [Bacillota bacterium]